MREDLGKLIQENTDLKRDNVLLTHEADQVRAQLEDGQLAKEPRAAVIQASDTASLTGSTVSVDAAGALPPAPGASPVSPDDDWFQHTARQFDLTAQGTKDGLTKEQKGRSTTTFRKGTSTLEITNKGGITKMIPKGDESIAMTYKALKAMKKPVTINFHPLAHQETNTNFLQEFAKLGAHVHIVTTDKSLQEQLEKQLKEMTNIASNAAPVVAAPDKAPTHTARLAEATGQLAAAGVGAARGDATATAMTPAASSAPAPPVPPAAPPPPSPRA